jgi:hypothetical protein
MVRKSLVALCLLACVAGLAWTAEPSTTINGIVTNRSGYAAGTGTVSCALSEAGTWDDGGTPTGVTTPVTGTIAPDGTVALVLTPNDMISPSGTYWVCDWSDPTGRWRDQPIVSNDVDPVAISEVPRQALDLTEKTFVYDMFVNWATAPADFQFDANGDLLWDVELSDDGTNSGLVLRNGFPYIQFGNNAKLKVKLCTSIISFFYDNDADGTYDAATDFCWGQGGYDYDCNCVADVGAGSGDMTRAVYDTDLDGTVDLAEAVVGGGSSPAGFALDGTANWYTFNADEDGTSDVALFDPRLVDSNGDGTLDLDITAGGLGGLHGDATYAQRFAIFPGGYSSDPFDYASGFVMETNPVAGGVGAFYPIVSDPNYATLGAGPLADIGTSTKKWRDGYFSSVLYVGTALFNNVGYSNTYEGAPNYWNSAAGQSWKTDSDYDDSSTRKYDWTWQTGVATTVTAMHLDGDATPEYWIDVNGDGTKDIRFDGADNPAHGESLTWDGTASAARWAAGGASTQVDIDGDGTREISKTGSYLYIDANEDGTSAWTIGDSSMSYSGATPFSFNGYDGIWLNPDADSDGTGTVYIDNDQGGSKFVWDFTLPDCDGDGSALGYDLTTGLLVCGDDDGTGDVTDVFGCASGDCNDISVADTEQLDFSAVNNSATTEGLVLPQNTSVLTGTATGQIGFDTTDGRGAVYVGGLNNGLAMAVPVNVQSPEYVYLFTDAPGSSSYALPPFFLIEGTSIVASTVDAAPETTSSAIGVQGCQTGTTSGNECTIGIAYNASTATQQFEPKKMRLFGARGSNPSKALTATRKLAVGGVRTSSDGNPYTKTDGIFFWCDPAADLDNDGTVGDVDSDGTATTHPDGDCADANEDADDCKWYAVTMNNATDNAKISTATNTTATKSTVDCSGSTLTFQKLEIAFDGTTVAFYIDGSSVRSDTNNIPADGRRLANWGMYADQAIAAAKGWQFDWMRYYGIR